MRTATHALAAAFTLAFAAAPLAGCVDNLDDPNDPNARAGSELGTTADDLDGPMLSLYAGPFLTGAVVNVTGNLADLGSADDQTWSLKNNALGVFTVWSGKNFTGRCQVILPAQSFGDLSIVDIGPARISSVQSGATCATGGDTDHIRQINQTATQRRVRLTVDAATGSWDQTPGGGDSVVHFSKNAWRVVVETQYLYGGWTDSAGKTYLADDALIGDHAVYSHDQSATSYETLYY
ncbi:MAG TPA: hypothetical protein VHE35_28430 [Kofleriaceae bacterium]|nr:hypothetical protein [Kofleriaceae bacterium]